VAILVGHVVGISVRMIMLFVDSSGLAAALLVRMCDMTWCSKSKYVFLAVILQHLPSDQVHELAVVCIFN